MSERGGGSYIGIDESNHGRFPEIFVAVLSNNPGDVIISRTPSIPKRRKPHKNIAEKLSKRDYSFVLLTEKDLQEDARDRTLGVVIASLLQDLSITSPVEIYIDGQISRERERYVLNATQKVTGIDSSEIELYTGEHLDERVGLVNIADEAAHWLYSKSIKRLSEHKRFRPIRRDYYDLLR